jgi:hypothetical protein
VPQPGTKGSPRGCPERCGLENPLVPVGKGYFVIFKYFQKKFQIISDFLEFFYFRIFDLFDSFPFNP